MVENEELVVINLYNSLLRVKVMVGILYEPKALTPEKVRALAGIVKMNLDITIDNREVENSEAFDSLEEAADFLINLILGNKALDDFRDLANTISSDALNK
jgi:hypothetical protein